MANKILVVEDEKDIFTGLEMNLRDEGYEVMWSPDGQDGLRKALSETPDLILLDLMLPGMDGISVCRRLRQMEISTPIIMLTAKGKPIDKVLGLEIGADDYMVKPFDINELLARIRVQLRRNRKETGYKTQVYSLEDVEIYFDRMEVKKGGQVISLTGCETEILKHMISSPGRVITREELLNKVWGYQRFPTTRTIDTHISRLRKKIEDDPAKPRHLLSVYGEGYRFVQ